MNFSAFLMYLGAQSNQLKDGTIFYKVSFFDPTAGAPVQLNVMESRQDLVTLLSSFKFGTACNCNFQLVAKDNLYRLVLVSCEPA